MGRTKETKIISTLCRMCNQGCGLEVTLEGGQPLMLRSAKRPYNKGWLCIVNIPQGWEEANANELTRAEGADPISGFPNLKSLRCRVRKI